MAMSDSSLFVVLLLFCQADIALQFEWGPELTHGTKLKVCENQPVTFSWTMRFGRDEILHGRWYTRKLEDGTDTMTVSGKTTIFEPQGRVLYHPNGSLTILRPRVNDTGDYNFTVGVLTVRVGKVNHYTIAASLFVLKLPELVGGQLQRHVPKAVSFSKKWETHWRVKLACGTFSYLGHPPVTIIWKLPDTTIVPSASEEHGNFTYFAPIPFNEGAYICKIDPESTPLVCLDQKDRRTSELLRKEYTVLISSESRLLILENRVDRLEIGWHARFRRFARTAYSSSRTCEPTP